MTTSGWTRSTMMPGALLLSLMLGAPTAGHAAPWQLGAQGVIYTADGRLAEGVHLVTFKVYADAQATEPVWEEDVPLGLAQGRFATMLPADADDLSLAAVLQEAAGAELGVVLDDGVELDRAPLAAAPYAVVAERVRSVAASQVTFEDGAAQPSVQTALAALAAKVEALEAQVAAADQGLPSGAVMMFLDACPSGWAEVTELAGRVPLGVGPSFAIGTTGGALVHGHAVTVDSAGAHAHDASTITVTVDKLSGGMADLATWMPTVACATSSTPASSSCASGFAAAAIYHNHPASAAGDVASGGAHVHTASAAEAGHLPPYRVVRFCGKP